MKRQITNSLFVAVLVVFLVLACSADQLDDQAVLTDETHIRTVLDWRIDRLDRLKAPNGYLTLVGLYWLDEGMSTFGASHDNDIVFPYANDDHIGSFELRDDLVTMIVNDNVDVRINDQPVSLVQMPDDTTGELVLATRGSLAWGVVNRERKLGIRLRDYENPSLEALPPIRYYDIDRNWRVEATLKRYEEPRIINVNTVIEGLGYNPESPGILTFEFDGVEYSLEAYDSDDDLFIIFGDRTSGKETYPAGRFLYAPKPGEDGKVIIDFNRAYNPPCAFNDFSTCPVATPRNRLSVAVEAGEKFDESLHFNPRM